MPETFRQRCDRWRLDELLIKHSGLRLRPTTGSAVTLSGVLAFSAERENGESIDDEYELELWIPDRYPSLLPHVWETNRRIPPSFHKLTDGSLCLGSETRLRLILSRSPSILSFVELCVVPYLYGHSYYEKHGELPFGELSHGSKGIIEDLADVFGVDKVMVAGFVKVAAMKKRVANKRPCPCGGELRLGLCHRKRINMLRRRLGRRWFGYLKLHLDS
jgi:hypothetical protein